MEKIFHNLVENAIMHGQATLIRFGSRETRRGSSSSARIMARVSGRPRRT